MLVFGIFGFEMIRVVEQLFDIGVVVDLFLVCALGIEVKGISSVFWLLYFEMLFECLVELMAL